MKFDPDKVETVLIDSYSTLVDEASTQDVLAEYTDNPEALARLWYERSSIYGTTTTILGEYRTTAERRIEALNYAASTMGIGLSKTECKQIVEAIEYEPYDDVRNALERIYYADFEIYILSNGDPDMLDRLVQTADVADLVSDTISAADIGIYKPDPRLYRHAAQYVNTPVSNIAHVTASWYDIQGASYTGMQAIWIRRRKKRWENLLNEPHLKIDSLCELADKLD